MLEGVRIENQHLSCKSKSHIIPSKFFFIAFAFGILDWGARKEHIKAYRYLNWTFSNIVW